MKEFDIASLLKKTEELRALFVLGQRVIPFLEEIFLFIQELTPQLARISRSIEENLQKIPNASKQLEQVTKATEMATTEILNTLEGITYKASVIQTNASEIQAVIDRQETSRKQALYLCQRLIDSGIEELKELRELLGRMDVHSRIYKATEETKQLMESISNDATQIMITLQVQDITAQQLAAVNHLIEQTQKQLRGIVERFYQRGLDKLFDELDVEVREKATELPPEKAKVTRLHREIAFDEEAIAGMEAQQQRQEVVEELVRQFEEQPLEKEGGDSGGGTTVSSPASETSAQSEDHFSETSHSASEVKSSDQKSQDSSDSDDDGKRPIAQDDINALFD